MMSKCANPSCTSVFRYLRDGKLFQVPAGDSAKFNGPEIPGMVKPLARDEFFWLCGDCSKDLTIVVDPVDGVRTVPRNQTQRALRAAG
ncbi:MAG TPA: hypothetical protein VGL89_02870 [Candidatus Koribacter sp.]|jgi:hypothetical protein